MIICGIKVTHDGGVALLDSTRLIFSIEIEKLNNNPRYSAIGDLAVIQQVLEENGYSVDQVDVFVVDGWGRKPFLRTRSGDTPVMIPVAPYGERYLSENLLQSYEFPALAHGVWRHPYCSYPHLTSHIMGAYCSSPFARYGETAYVLVWDGGIMPRLYFFDPMQRRIDNLGPIFRMKGTIYATFAMHFSPFTPQEMGTNYELSVLGTNYELSVPGKVMAYTGLGAVRDSLFLEFERVYNDLITVETFRNFPAKFSAAIIERISGHNIPVPDILASFQAYISHLLVESLIKAVKRSKNRTANLCLGGGCALNIKWNSRIRDSGVFDQVWVPPFTNDTGAALGAACAHLVNVTDARYIDWDVYSGPHLTPSCAASGWDSRPCNAEGIAEILHYEQEPVIVLNGRSELGPRALGNRSILAPAVKSSMKAHLNAIKQRQDYRPVAPICLEDRAIEIFSPGAADPYMLFDHTVKSLWKDRIPAVVHVDGTARLETINAAQNELVWRILKAYEQLSNIPVLCNTSANFKDCGFFPDVYSATSWRKTKYVWSNRVLYINQLL